MNVLDFLKTKNKVLYILILCLVITIVLLYISYRKRLLEGFQSITENAKALLKYSYLDLELSNIKEASFPAPLTNSYPWSVTWIPPPDKVPQAMIDDVNKTYRMWTIQARLLKDPSLGIRLDWRTHIPYTFDFSLNPGASCFQEYTIEPGTGSYNSGAKYYSKFKLNANEESLNTAWRPKCKVQVTPQFLATLPYRLQLAYIDWILNEQQQVINAKITHADLNGRTCADKRNIANSLFTTASRKAYDDKRKQERDAAKTQTNDAIKTAASTSLKDVAAASGRTALELTNNPTLRAAVKTLPAVQALKSVPVGISILKATPYAVFSTAMKTVAESAFKSVLAGLVDFLRGGDPFAGMECPIGYVESEEIQNDPTLQAMGDIFPNPLTDITNQLATKGICTKYVEGVADVKEKFCDMAYILPPQRLVPASPPARPCDMDMNIEKKLQLASDYLTSITMTNTGEKYFYVIQRFDYVANPSEYFVEAAFQAILYTKNPIPTMQMNDKDPLPSARNVGFMKGSSPLKRRMRFYFNKNGCDYSVFGFYSGDRLLFFQERDESRPIDFVPTVDPKISILQYALIKNIANPLAYAIENSKNQSIVSMIQKEEADRQVQEENERKERASLLISLNPKQDASLKDSLESLNLEDLRERQALILKLNDTKYTDRFWALSDLKAAAELVDEKNIIIANLNPSKDPRYGDFLKTLSINSLRDRQANKSKREDILRQLNTLRDSNLELELQKLETPDLEKRLAEKKQRDDWIHALNPANDLAITTTLSQLSYADLMKRYQDWSERQPLLQYFNPTNNTNLNTSYLDKFTTAQLKERKDLIQQLAATPEAIQTLNALDIDTLKLKLKEAQDAAAAKAASEAARQSQGKAGWTKQQWLDSAGKEGGLPLGHDCLIPKRSRRNCPPDYPY